MGIKNRLLGGLAGAYLGAFSREQRVARAELGCAAVAPVALLPVTREMTRRLKGLLRKPKRFGATWRGVVAGQDVSIINTGVGAPSAEGKVVAALGVGARVLIRLDICGGLGAGMEVGDVVVAARAVPFDGVSRLIGDGAEVDASLALLAVADDAFGSLRLSVRRHVVAVATVDTFHHQTSEMRGEWSARAAAVDMETSVIYVLAQRAGAHALAVMAVSDIPAAGQDPFGEKPFPYDKYLRGLDALTEFAPAIVEKVPGSLTRRA